jgi:hypothetical protein
MSEERPVYSETIEEWVHCSCGWNERVPMGFECLFGLKQFDEHIKKAHPLVEMPRA